MLIKIASFEWRYQVRSPVFLISFAVFFLLSFGGVTVDSIQIGSRGNVNVNSPFAVLQMQAVMTLFAVFVMVAMTSAAMLRDRDTRFAPIVYTTSVTEGSYLIGRFVGTTLAALCVLAAVPAAVALGSLMPWLDPGKVGPFDAYTYFYALFAFGLPSLLIVSACLFAVTTLTQSMVWTYVAAIGAVLLNLVLSSLLRDPTYDVFSSLVDPFGGSALTVTTRYWTAAERNTLLPPLTGLMLANRLLWTLVALALLAVIYRVFSFRQRAQKAATPERGGAPDVAASSRFVRVPSLRFDHRTRRDQFAHLVRFDAGFVLKSPIFFVLLGIGVLNSIGNLWFAGQVYGSASLPATRLMIQALGTSFALMPTIIAVLYAGELVWREREQRMHEIVDVTSAPDWVYLCSKLIAVSLVLLVSVLVGVATAVGVQAAKGFTDFQFARYALWFVLPMTVNVILLAVLAVFVQTVVPQKYIGWGAMLLVIVVNVALSGAGIEHELLHFAGTTPVPLSDMNGMGRFWVGAAWLQAYWAGFGVILATLSYALWRRGAAVSLRQRIRLLPNRLRGLPLAFFSAGVALWLGTGCYVFYNTNILNRYETTADRDERLARIEKELLAFETVAQPEIVDVALEVEIFPAAARLTASGTYVLENRTTRPIEALHVNWFKDTLRLDSLEVDGGRVRKDYPELHYRIFALSPAMLPGETRKLRFRSTLEQLGFRSGSPQTEVVPNGSFARNTDFAPGFGITRSVLLKDRATRRKHGLPEDLRMPKFDDEFARGSNMLRHDSGFVTADIAVTTDDDQTAIAPGVVKAESKSNGRKTTRFRSDAPMLNYFSVQSARYSVAKDTWKGVDLAVYFHAGHAVNVRRMLEAMKASLSVFSERFAPYQFHQARIVEFPAFATLAESFANTIPYSESVGFQFTQDGPSGLDMVSYFTAHEMAHQWWGHQLMPADKQGGSMLLESLAQYSALLVMEKMVGRERVRRFTKTELDLYLRGRGGEAVEELPLARVENQPYIHYHKGTLVMYWLREVVGEASVDNVLRKMLARHALKGAPYADSSEFLSLLRAEVGPVHDSLITDLFEKITLYDVKATAATARKRPDGRFDLRLEVEARKFYADGAGHETETPLNEAFDIGVFTRSPGDDAFDETSVLHAARVTLASGKRTFDTVVDRLPAFAGIDPYNRRIDRNSDDNVVGVTLR
jgi:ABC-2 type transport system permease protein